jgi:uncharacterized protein (DUF983 family)
MVRNCLTPIAPTSVEVAFVRSHVVNMADEPSDLSARSNKEAIRRGLLCRCPHCGEGKLFDGYLTVVRNCASCDEPLSIYRAADAPAFITMCIMGLLLIPVLGFGFTAFRADPLMLAYVITAIIGALTLLVLRLVKGAFVGFLWAQREIDPGA